jgi:hypothetical protein
MQSRIFKLGFALIAPLFLFGCILTPGKFVSNLTLNADRSFAFAYQGEVYAIDPSSAMGDLGKSSSSDDSTDGDKVKADAATAASKKQEQDKKNKALAEALSKEAGYRAVRYLGDGKFMIDYAVSGTLNYNFVFPFNSDAEAVFPFVMIELRANNSVRIKAPGFANDSKADKTGMGAMGGADAAASKLDGVFTLDTDAEIISQNNEDGAIKSGKRSIIKWRATPLTKDAPTAVLRMAK